MATLEAVHSQTSVKARSARSHRVLAWIGTALGRIAVILITLVLCLPVLLAPITT